MKKGFTLIDLIIVLVILFIFGGIIASAINSTPEQREAVRKIRERPCIEYSNYRLKNVPARCIEYFYNANTK